MSGFDVIIQFFRDARAVIGGAVAGPHLAGVGLWLFGFLFLWAGSSKLRRPTLIAMTLADFGLVRGIHAGLGAALGGVELALGLWLVSGVEPALAMGAGGGVLALFATVIAGGLVSGKRVACMCFGDESSIMSWATLARTSALAAAAFWLGVAGGAPVPRWSQPSILEAVTASALIALVLFASRIPRLIRWNPIPRFESEVEP